MGMKVIYYDVIPKLPMGNATQVVTGERKELHCNYYDSMLYNAMLFYTLLYNARQYCIIL